jgi:hypothetical protein
MYETDFCLPEDLRAWMPEEELLTLLFAALHLPGEAAICRRPLPAGRPRVLLALLTYGYAVGIYGSDELEACTQTNPQLHYLSERKGVTAAELRRFRRYHRTCVQETLTALFELAWAKARSAGVIFPEPPQTLVCSGGMGLVCSEAAERRIDEAVLRDSMALDV